MLHKKKRWTAAMHATGQTSVPMLLPAAANTKSHWSVHFSANPSSKPLPRHSTPPSSTSLQKSQASASTHPVDSYPSSSLASQLVSNRLPPMDCPQITSKLAPPPPLSQPVPHSVPNEVIPTMYTTSPRNDLTANLLTSIAQSSDLLQPGLLLQILPQEYIEKYTKSLEKRLTSDKNMCDLTTSIGKAADGCSKPNEPLPTSSNPSLMFRTSQPPVSQHRTEAGPSPSSDYHILMTGGPNNFSCQSPLYKPNTIDQTKNMRSTPGSRVTTNTQTPMFSCSNIANTTTQQFSPHRRLSGSTDPHSVKGWNSNVQPPSPQQPQLSGLDYSTISAVAHAAGLFHSPSRLNAAAAAAAAAAALFSPWDTTTNSMPLVSQAREANARPESTGHKPLVAGSPYTPTLSVASSPTVPLGYHPDCSSTSPLINRSAAMNMTEAQKHRNSIDLPTSSIRVPTPIALKPVPDPRRQIAKSAIPLSKQSDNRPQLPPNSSISLTTDNVKSFRATPPWLPSEGCRVEQTVHPNMVTHDRTMEAADARLSILHDAKIAALSVDWSSVSSSVTPASTVAAKNLRARSSSSFSSPLSSSSSEISPMLSAHLHQAQHGSIHSVQNRGTPTPSDTLYISPTSMNIGSTSPNPLVRARQQVTTCSSPVVIPGPIRSPSSHSPSCAVAPPPSRHMAGFHQTPATVATNNQVGRNGAFHTTTSLHHLSHNRISDTKPTHHSTSPTPLANRVTSGTVYTKPVQSEPVVPWAKPAHSATQPTCTYVFSVSNTSMGATTTDGSAVRQVDCRSSSMPLKKRLIQRYEADSSSCKPASHTSPEQADLGMRKFSPHSSAHSDRSGISATDEYRSTFPSPTPDPRHIHSHHQQTTQPVHSGDVFPIDRVPNVLKPEYAEETMKQRRSYKNRSLSNRSDVRPERKSSVKRVSAVQAHKRSTGFTGSRKLDTSARFSEDCPRPSKAVKYEGDPTPESDQEPIETGRTRNSTGLRRSGRGDSSPICTGTTADVSRRRLAAVNGEFLLMTALHAHRTDSSASRGSSSSLRSVEVDEESDAEQTCTMEEQATGTYQSSKSNRYGFETTELVDNHTVIQSLTESVRKPKRAAALAASAATAASVTMSAAKRHRPALAHPESGPQQTSEALEDDVFGADEDSLSADDTSSVMTVDSKSTSTTSCNPTLQELSAALMEDKTSLDELTQHLPGPPDLQQLTDRSLHPGHSLDYYKSSRTAFVQLVSCNDPGLKPIPKCRACRQIKRSHCEDTSTNVGVNGAEMGSVSDEDSRERTTAKSNSALLSETGHFKRPTGRSSQTDRDRNKENSGDPERSKSDKPRRKNVSSSPVSVFCRFWGFRKLIYNNRGILKIAGFCHSNEASPLDRSLWEMHHSVSPSLDFHNAKYIVERAGALFCRLLRLELAVLTGNRDRESPLDRGPGAPSKNGVRLSASAATSRAHPTNGVAWKRPVKGVREMCDVCETTMFNTHWVCVKCGYSVCVDCQEDARENKRTRQLEKNAGATESSASRDRSKGKQTRVRAGPPGWASCTTTRQHHDPERLLLTSLLPAATVGKLLHRVHRIARHYQIRLGCDCPVSLITEPRETCLDLTDLANVAVSGADNSLGLLADLALKTDTKDITVSTATRMHLKSEQSDEFKRIDEAKLPLHTWITKPNPTSPKHLKDSDECGARTIGKYSVLQLHEARATHVMEAFQHEWRANRPVVISGCQHNFDAALWSPRSFAEEFGPLRTTLVDCATGMELTRYPLRTFWDGFERKSRRLMSKDGRSLCLKLKDWPTTDDFAELQPHRFADLMNNLPLPEYTCRDGQMNLASRLTSFFVCPDLGPKLYVAYGTGGSRSMGTTNLHVDIADAINILLYVGYPCDTVDESNANAEAVLNVLRQAQLDPVYLERATRWMKNAQFYGHSMGSGSLHSRTNEESTNDCDTGPPGALWHIFLPEDMPALREFLTRITEEETGAPLEPGSDPIHDQLFYLDQPLLDRLYTCTGVLPCTLVQFRGDAIFIPAGSAHQVRNLNSCIKAAVDFVSPEHLPQCFQLIEEFRRLSTTHQNHEDKLQVKNMLFHATKDALSALLCSSDAALPEHPFKPEECSLTHRISRLIDSDTASSRTIHDVGKHETVSDADYCVIQSVCAVDSDSSERSVNLTQMTSESQTSKSGTSAATRTKGRPGRPKSVLSQSLKPDRTVHHSESCGNSKMEGGSGLSDPAKPAGYPPCSSHVSSLSSKVPIQRNE